MQGFLRRRDFQIALIVVSVLAGVFACAVLWEFLIETTTAQMAHGAAAQRWAHVLTATGFSAIALVIPAIVTWRWSRRQEQTEAVLRDVVEMASDWLWQTDEQHRFTEFSMGATQISVSTIDYVMGKTRFELRALPDCHDEEWREHEADLAARRPFKNFEYPIDLGEGLVRHLRVSGRPIFSSTGVFQGYRGTGADITEKIIASSKLRDSRAQLAEAQRMAHLGNWVRDFRTDILVWSDEVFRIFGYEPQSFKPDIKFFMTTVHPDDMEKKLATQREAIETGDRITIDHRIVRPNGEIRWVHQESIVEHDEQNRPLRAFGTIQDITERKQEEEKHLQLIAEKDREAEIRQLAERERDQAMDRLTEAIESISEGFAIWAPDDRLVMCNTRYREGYKALEDCLVPGLHFADFLKVAIERGVFDLRGLPAEDFIRTRLAEHRNPTGVIERKGADGRWMRISKQRTNSGAIVGIWTDITERKKAEQTIRDLALNDSLTGLANRNRFHRRLTESIALAKRHGTRVALLFLDLDRFKQINDEIGHPGGDTLLQHVSRRFIMLARETDTVARLGGDEFAIIMTDVTSSEAPSLFAKRILDSMAAPFMVSGNPVSSGTSIGISVFPDDDTGTDGLIRKADLALYQAKSMGRGTFALYDDEMHSRVRRARTIELELRAALAFGEFVLHYQPQFDITGTVILGAEALVRWRHPERGLLPPAEFIDIAETSGLIVDIGKWVLREACAQSKRWTAAGLPEFGIAVNISARQFKSDDLVESVRAVLEETGIEPRLVELEITESMVMHDVEQTAARLGELSDLGLVVSIDDFGTGYSSLAYLKQFPVHRLKIDQSFVGMLDAESEDAAIVEAVIRLGHSLRLKVTAEGVETRQQLAMLRVLGCDEVQGYYFSKPVPADAFADFVKSHLRSQETALSDALT